MLIFSAKSPTTGILYFSPDKALINPIISNTIITNHSAHPIIGMTPMNEAINNITPCLA
jgi:hypothetical protein